MFNLIETEGKLITSYTQELETINGLPSDKVETSFYQLSGSIVRVTYSRRSTKSVVEFVPVNSWEYAELERMAHAA